MSDVCLILEGTYPYVSGGVSTWIHQIVSSMRDIRFSILYISPFPNPRRELKYRVPPNVTDIQDLYLHDYSIGGEEAGRRRRREAMPRVAELSRQVLGGQYDKFADLLGLFRDPKKGLRAADVFYSLESWEILSSFYKDFGERASFLDFFWTWRAICLPFFQVITAPIPRARLYHTVSTGYAGLAASIAKAVHGQSVILTEHGVYTHERLLEISQASWIYTPQRDRFQIQRELPFFKRLWIGFFELLGRLTYQHADRVITLFEGNRTRQILGGAPPEKISIIPNGIDMEAFYPLRSKRRPRRKKAVAFIGRVVSIKDVKTFIQAAGLVLAREPETDFLILGPTDEEPEYTAECRQLVEARGLNERVRFLGKVGLQQHYPNLDVVVLTSLSEAQPYVILEANASGIPVVATDVGACREMLEGRLPEDRRIGPSGILTSVANPEATAAGILKLLSDPKLWSRMSDSGRARTLRFYDQDDMVSQYLNLYEKLVR